MNAIAARPNRSVWAIFLVGIAVISIQATYGFSQRRKAVADGVWVVRAGDAVSCSENQGDQALRGAKVRIIKRFHQQAKGLHVQMCGAPTGELNAYMVPKSQLPKAQALEFTEATPEQLKSINGG